MKTLISLREKYGVSKLILNRGDWLYMSEDFYQYLFYAQNRNGLVVIKNKTPESFIVKPAKNILEDTFLFRSLASEDQIIIEYIAKTEEIPSWTK